MEKITSFMVMIGSEMAKKWDSKDIYSCCRDDAEQVFLILKLL